MNFSALDPSIALGFYCHSEAEFDDWVCAVRELIIEREKRPMFEVSFSFLSFITEKHLENICFGVIYARMALPCIAFLK